LKVTTKGKRRARERELGIIVSSPPKEKTEKRKGGKKLLPRKFPREFVLLCDNGNGDDITNVLPTLP